MKIAATPIEKNKRRLMCLSGFKLLEKLKLEFIIEKGVQEKYDLMRIPIFKGNIDMLKEEIQVYSNFIFDYLKRRT